MTRKLLLEVNQAWQAEAISSALQDRGIDFEMNQKAKEYSSIISGIDSLTIEIFVDEAKFIQASELLKKISSQSISDSDEQVVPKNYYRRVIIFSMIGVILLPIIFNIFASINFVQMRDQQVSKMQKWFAGLVLISGWFMACIMLLYILKH